VSSNLNSFLVTLYNANHALSSLSLSLSLSLSVSFFLSLYPSRCSLLQHLCQQKTLHGHRVQQGSSFPLFSRWYLCQSYVSHVTHVNESSHTYKWGSARMYEWVLLLVRMNRISHINHSASEIMHLRGSLITSHVWLNGIANGDESCESASSKSDASLCTREQCDTFTLFIEYFVYTCVVACISSKVSCCFWMYA